MLGAVALTILLASSACTRSATDRGTAGGTVATEPLPTTTTNPYAVPAVIDVAYINRVLAGLDAVRGNTLRIVIRTNTIPPEAYDQVKALYTNPAPMQETIDGYQRGIRERFVNYKPDPGNRISTVARIVTTQPTCIFVQVKRDYSAVSLNPTGDFQTQWVGLRPLDQARDPHGYNPTSWAYVYDGFEPDRSQPSDPCAKS